LAFEPLRGKFADLDRFRANGRRRRRFAERRRGDGSAGGFVSYRITAERRLITIDVLKRKIEQVRADTRAIRASVCVRDT
jgi:hypothetical protein